MMEEIQDLYTLSPLQQGMLFHSAYAKNTGMYITQLAVTFKGQLHVVAFERAWQKVMERHSILRTGFIWGETEQPLQVVYNQVALNMKVEDWRNLEPEHKTKRIQQRLRAERSQDFELTEAPLMRFTLLRTAEQEYDFIWSYHHVLLDGWSLPIVLQEVFAFYDAMQKGEQLSLPTPRPYHDYIKWLREQDSQQLESFWRKFLSGFSEPTPLGLSQKSNQQSSHDYHTMQQKCSLKLTQSLTQFSQTQQITLNTLVQAAWSLLLHHYSGESDVVYGATVSGRPAQLVGVEQMVGLFINTLPVRVQIEKNITLRQWLLKLQKKWVELRQYEHTPLLDIQGWSDVPQGTPLFETLFVFENYPLQESDEQGVAKLEFSNVRAVEQTNYPLTLVAAPGQELLIKLMYDRSRFSDEVMARILEQLQYVLFQMMEFPDHQLSRFTLLQEKDQHQLDIWNQTALTLPKNDTLDYLIEKQAQKTPERTAIIDGERVISYQEMDQQSNQMAHELIQNGIQPGDRVGICVDRSAEMIMAIVGTLKAGATYVPLDVKYPADRIRYMLQDAGVTALISDQSFLQTKQITVDDTAAWRSNQTSAVDKVHATDSLAYLIYTSGSTGKPKGVMVTHHNAVALMHWAKSVYTPDELRGVLAATSICFDLSVFEMFVPLTSGGTIILASDALALPKLPHRQRVTLLNTVPSAATELLRQQAIPPTVQVINLAGEPLSRFLAQGLYGVETVQKVYNLYGPSEDTTYSTYALVEKESSQAPTIGKPIANTQAFVLDSQQRRVPIGIIGELYLAGAGVTRGYYRQPELTKQRYIDHPKWGRLYRTGDLARFSPSGELEFLGRADFQVKIRGFRIELGEIEAILQNHPAIEEVVVTVREEKQGSPNLIAYIVSNTEEDWRGFLHEKLPEYMIPQFFVAMDAIPLTPNGKIDRKSLPTPEKQSTSAIERASQPLEEIVANIWADVLGREFVGLHENFFALGGHSLLATQVISRLEEVVETELPLSMIFTAPTIAELVQSIQQMQIEQEGMKTPALQSFDVAGNQFPLSFAQQRIWFFEQMSPGQSTYNLPFALRLKGELDIERLQQSLHRLLAKHEILRTTFHEIEGKAIQQIHKRGELDFRVENLPQTGAESICAELIGKELQISFDLSSGPLMRVILYRISEQESVLLLHMHHIISDGWSMGVWFRELFAPTDDTTEEHKLSVQYKDFTLWQREWMQGEIYTDQLQYWQQQLDDVPILDLPTDFTRPTEQSYHGDRLTFTIPTEIVSGLRNLSREENATMYMTLLASFQLLLSRYSGQKDIAVGSPIANRQDRQLEELIGFFVNTLVYRTDLTDNPTFRELIGLVRKTALDAYAHQDIPFEKIVDEMKIERNLSHSPLFQTMFVMQNLPFSAQPLDSLHIEPYECKHQVAKFDLTLTIMEEQEQMVGSMEYNSALFREITIKRLIDHFQQLLSAILADPDQTVAKISFLSPVEKAQQLPANLSAHAVNQSLVESFAAQVQRHGEKVALRQKDQQLTYLQLNEQANQLAHFLRRSGMCEGDLVAVYLERSVEYIVSILAIVKAGGAYLPLDFHDPQERLHALLHHSQAKRLITQSKWSDKWSDSGVPLHFLDQRETWQIESTRDLPSLAQQEDLVYVMYTSGSTGKPKGVEVLQRGVLRLVKDTNYVHLGSDEVFLQLAPIAFDASTFEIWGSLLNGSTLVLMPPETPSLNELAEILQRYHITTLWLTVGLFNLMVEYQLPALQGLKQLLVGGDIVSPSHVKKVLSLGGVQVINGYGPTENTTFTCCYPIPTDWTAESSVPIGKAINHTQVYILDEWLQMVPLGVAGELHIGGDGLARGYVQNAELTAKSFIEHPEFGRLYRTGDRVRYLEDGNIQFLGRMDQQVKIRGFRIELGEIEEALRQHQAVREAVVKVHEKRLFAYLITADDKIVREQEEWRNYLQDKLPEYMLPAAFILIEEIPLTRNGKVDRRRLPDHNHALLSTEKSDAPRDEVETTLLQVWKDVLNIEHISIHDNFFQLGGDSILSIQMVAKCKQQGLTLTPKQIFQSQTIAELATVVAIHDFTTNDEVGVLTGEMPLLPIQHWFFAQEMAEPHHWNQAVMLQVEPEITMQHFSTVIQYLMEHHDALRLQFTNQDGQWMQRYATLEESVSTEYLDLAHLDVWQQKEGIERIANRAQSQFDLQQGPLFRAVYFRLGTKQKDRLLLVAHHLLIDGVSWRILLEDLQHLLVDRATNLPAKSTSYRTWAKYLSKQARSAVFAEEREYWEDLLLETYPRLPLDYAQGENTEESAEVVTSYLTKMETKVLLQKVPHAYRTQITEILLTALARTLVNWTRTDRFLIHMEGHGREQFNETMDLSRTVGWFTSLYPVALKSDLAASSQESVDMIKKELQQIPNKGIGYGILQYLSDPPLVSDQTVELSFNYLGQFAQGKGASQGLGLQVADDPTGQTISPQSIRPYLIDVIAVTSDEQLHITWKYCQSMFKRETIQRLAEQLVQELRQLLLDVEQIEQKYLPTDFPLATVDPQQLLAEMDLENDIEDIYPVTPLQQGLLFHTLYQDHQQDYVTQLSFTLSGAFDLKRFQQAWQTLVERHTILRTGFISSSAGEPHQVVYRHAEAEFTIWDWRTFAPEQQEKQVQFCLQQEKNKPFSWLNPPLMRCILIRLADDQVRFIWTHHHVLLDGWSIPILLQELFAFYQGESCPPAQPFAKYISWLQQQEEEKGLLSWQQRLQGFTETTHIPCDHLLGGVPNRQEIHQWLPKEISQSLQRYARNNQLTLNTVLQGAWAILLSRLSRSEDIVYGITTSGRPGEVEGIERMIGLFINTLPMRVRLGQEDYLKSWLQDLQQEWLNLRQYEYLPLVKIQEYSEVPQGTPLFETLFVFENYPLSPLAERKEEPVLQIDDLITFDQSHFPFVMVAGPGEQISLKVSYDANLYDSKMVQLYLQYYHLILQQMIEKPNGSLADISLVSQQQRQQLLVAWNETKEDFPHSSTLGEQFSLQAKATPEAIALSEPNQVWTYQQCETKANQLSRYLISHGVKKGDRVGVALPRSSEFIITVLAIVKAGAIYVPFDPTYPQSMIQHMVQDSNAQILITERIYQSVFTHTESKLLFLSEQKQQIAQMSQVAPEVSISATSVAKLIYTSGSTGLPKGVALDHRAILRLVKGNNDVKLDANETLLFHSSTSFDVATFEIWGSLLNGARLAIMAIDIPTLTELAHTIREQKVTTLWLTAGLFTLMVDHQLPALSGVHQLIAGGDVVSVPHVRKVLSLEGVQVINGYGPSECTTFSTFYPVPQNFVGASLPIGRPISNTHIYVLDEQMRPVPVGVVGEIYIGGMGLAQGYWNLTERTKESFVPHPFSDHSQDRLYRTGDLARYLPDGNLIFMGRRDQQVKVRGFRIELSTIETMLTQHVQVQVAVAKVVQNQLIAYVQGQVTEKDLKRFMGEHLPTYMVPSQIIRLDQWPLTPNGKVDYKALPQPSVTETGKASARNETELEMIALWEKVLNVSPVGIHDNFFALGGHSFHAMQLIAMVHEKFAVELPLSSLFLAPTIVEWVTHLQQEEDVQKVMICLNKGDEQQTKPIFLLHPQGGGLLSFASLISLLPSHLPVYGLQSVGYEGLEKPLDTVAAMTERYVKELKKVQDKGPYRLLGWSFGGCLAFEMAKRLEAQGEKVDFVALLDSTWMPSNEKDLLMKTFAHPDIIESQARELQVESSSPKVVVWFKNGLAYADYIPKTTIAADMYLFRAMKNDQPIGSYDWQPYTTGQYREIPLNADHSSILEMPTVFTLAEKVQQLLEQNIKVKEID